MRANHSLSSIGGKEADPHEARNTLDDKLEKGGRGKVCRRLHHIGKGGGYDVTLALDVGDGIKLVVEAGVANDAGGVRK